ncbi:MAG: hypothetical protein IKH04_10210 [Kiritimatiellae bacterium]|nr:hypothetical protein [Kiritimatiellia bacterium]
MNRIVHICAVFCVTCAGMAMGVAKLPGPRAVYSVVEALPFETGRDFYIGEGCEVAIAGGRLEVSPRDSTFAIRRQWFRPWPKRLDGAEEFILSLSRGVPGGTVRLTLCDESTKEPTTWTAAWTETIRFPTALPREKGCFLSRLAFEAPGGVPAAGFVIFGMKARVAGTAAEALALDVDTGNDIHVVNRPGGAAAATFRNLSAEAGAWSGRIVLSDFFGKVAELPFDCRLAPGGTAAVPLPVPGKFGIYRVKAEIAAGDGSAATKTVSFAKLVPREATPRWPRGTFRPGVNYHISVYPEADRALAMDALVAMGCKLCRGNLLDPMKVCPEEGVFDWTRSDALLGELEDRGIDMDAIIYACPKWARAEGWQTPDADALRHPAQFPTRPGFFRDYCERLSARYGTHVAYYEIGNEWDMMDERSLPEDEAVRILREAYAGIKGGCPEAVCIPAGWALPLESDRRNFRRPGFQRRLMDECRDSYDAYPVHLHGPFAAFREDLRQILDFRRASGIAQPWYANETALTSAHGAEDAVAETVWKKMLYSWSLGSIDYIWYNLRATGYNPTDSEQGYGLMTADFHPRAGMAAFSGLVDLFGMLSAEGPVEDTESLFIGRWSGMRDGMRRIVFAGWELAANHGCKARVRTDARAAHAVDLFGNRSSISIANGMVEWKIGNTPCALLLDGAWSAEIETVNRDSPSHGPTGGISVPPDFPEAPQMSLASFSNVVERFVADPENADRTWKGAPDLSVKVFLGGKADRIRVRVEVQDDAEATGDGVRAFFGPPARGALAGAELRKAGRDGETTRYEGEFAHDRFGLETFHGAEFGLVVADDDGQGPDVWMESAPGLRDAASNPAAAPELASLRFSDDGLDNMKLPVAGPSPKVQK